MVQILKRKLSGLDEDLTIRTILFNTWTTTDTMNTQEKIDDIVVKHCDDGSTGSDDTLTWTDKEEKSLVRRYIPLPLQYPSLQLTPLGSTAS